MTQTYKNRKLKDKGCNRSFTNINMKNLQPYELKKYWQLQSYFPWAKVLIFPSLLVSRGFW